jgi:Reverse transcriptase (RNA-dependent DNA polymerase)
LHLPVPTPSEATDSTSLSEEADLALEDNFAPHEMAFAAGLHERNVYPQTLRAALSKPNSLDWWKAVCTEFDNCEHKQVWTIVKKSNVPKGRKIIGNRWLFARKDDGRYRARTVAKGFSQIPGQDFNENHAPVTDDTTFHLFLILKLLFGLKSKQFDTETAFLYGTLEEEIYMQTIFTNRERKRYYCKGSLFIVIKIFKWFSSSCSSMV